jgi:hypothetical protein
MCIHATDSRYRNSPAPRIRSATTAPGQTPNSTGAVNHLRIVADSIYYGLALLRSNLVHAAMLTTGEAA